MADDSQRCVQVDTTTRNGLLADIDRGWDEVTNLDRDIAELVERRKWLVYDTIGAMGTASGIGNLLGIDRGILYNEYCKHKFECGTVKQAVLGVRSMFFDDSKEAFRRFNCLEIVFETDRICDGYKALVDSFSFVDMDNLEHRLTISIPTIYNDYCLYSTIYGANDEHIDKFPDEYEERCRHAGNISLCITTLGLQQS